MKSDFLKSLKREQEYFMLNFSDIDVDRFRLDYLRFAIAKKCDEFDSNDIQLQCTVVSIRLGVGVSYIKEKYSDVEYMKVSFADNGGFYCYTRFYGKLQDKILARLNYELKGIMTLARWKESGRKKRIRKRIKPDTSLFVNDCDEI